MCFVCGRDNPIGFHVHFFEDAKGCVRANVAPRAEHQGYPGVMHGGLVTALLDEIIGRTAIAQNMWCMTAKLNVRFRQPVPIGEPIQLKGEITRKTNRVVEGRGEVRLEDGTLLAEASGTMMKIPESRLTQYQSALQWWRVDE